MKRRKPFSRGFAISALVLTAFAAERPQITGIAEVTFFARDVAAARPFYTGLLGFRETAPGVFTVSGGQSVRIVPERDAGSDRLVSLTLATDNAEALRSYLRTKGIAVPAAIDRDALGRATFGVSDPDGHAIQFMERRSANRSRIDDAAVSTDLRHAGIFVHSLARSLAFYGEILGFRETWRGSRDGQTLDWVNVQVPDGADYLEFMLYRDLPAPDRRGTQHHICLFVDDLDRAAATLGTRVAAAAYARPLDIRTGTNRKRQLNLFDPDGTRVELMEARTVDGKPAPSSTAPPPRP